TDDHLGLAHPEAYGDQGGRAGGHPEREISTQGVGLEDRAVGHLDVQPSEALAVGRAVARPVLLGPLHEEGQRRVLERLGDPGRAPPEQPPVRVPAGAVLDLDAEQAGGLVDAVGAHRPPDQPLASDPQQLEVAGTQRDDDGVGANLLVPAPGLDVDALGPQPLPCRLRVVHPVDDVADPADHAQRKAPPSTMSVWPVRKRQASEHRNRATGPMSSSGSPWRPIGWSFRNSRYSASARLAASWPRLEAAPGAMALTTIPSRPHSRAAVRVRARIDSLAMLYAPY